MIEQAIIDAITVYCTRGDIASSKQGVCMTKLLRCVGKKYSRAYQQFETLAYCMDKHGKKPGQRHDGF